MNWGSIWGAPGMLPLMGLMMGLVYSSASGLLVLSFAPGVRLTRGGLLGYTCGAFAGAIGFGWVYTLIATRRFGDSWPGLCELALVAGMGLAAIFVGYLTARVAQSLVSSGPRQIPSRDLEGPVKDDSDWY